MSKRKRKREIGGDVLSNSIVCVYNSSKEDMIGQGGKKCSEAARTCTDRNDTIHHFYDRR